jgi:HJR/Mrr/RecB family endonuclease
LDIDLNFSDIFSAFLSVGPLFFPFWPLVIIAAFTNRKKRFSPELAISLWLPFFIWRMDMFVNGKQPTSFLLQEPLNTISFFIVGFLIIGTGIFRSYRKVRRIRRARSVEKLLELTPTEFEQAVGEMFKSSGYKVTHHGKSGDHGVDLVVRSKKAGKWVVQCKQRKGLVGEPILRDVYGAMHHEKAQGAVVVTTGRFSRPAIAWAEDKPIDLYDGDRLTELLQKRN